jgi:hypothetical protein
MMNRTILTVLASSLLLLGHLRAAGQTTAWKGTVNTSWSTAGNWTAGVPTASTDAIIGDANFTGANQPALSANSSCKSLTLGTGSKACTLKVGKNLTVSGSVMIGPNGTLSQSGGTLSLQGNWVATPAVLDRWSRLPARPKQ